MDNNFLRNLSESFKKLEAKVESNDNLNFVSTNNEIEESIESENTINYEHPEPDYTYKTAHNFIQRKNNLEGEVEKTSYYNLIKTSINKKNIKEIDEIAKNIF